jgi:hypothetical protein
VNEFTKALFVAFFTAVILGCLIAIILFFPLALQS